MVKIILVIITSLLTTIAYAADIPEGEVGDFRIVHEGKVLDGKGVCTLYEKDKYWMNADTAELHTQEFAIEKCKGKVLIGGLGIGMIVEELAKKEEVKEMVVVEIAPEVIKLVWEYVDHKGKGRVVCDDVFHYMETTKEKFDWVYLDIAPDNDSKESYEITLKCRKYAEKLVPPDRVLIWEEDMFLKKAERGDLR